jgi:DNA-binding response OmpR family regulator
MYLEEAYLDADAPAVSHRRAERETEVRATVLIVSSEPDFRRYVRECLRERTDVRVLDASSARDGVALAASSAPDLLVADAPEEDVTSLLSAIRAIVVVDELPRPPHDDDVRLRWLSRPFSAQELLAEVASLLG